MSKVLTSARHLETLMLYANPGLLLPHPRPFDLDDVLSDTTESDDPNTQSPPLSLTACLASSLFLFAKGIHVHIYVHTLINLSLSLSLSLALSLSHARSRCQPSITSAHRRSTQGSDRYTQACHTTWSISSCQLARSKAHQNGSLC
jgi:hypothetical protein